jgi:hypothetical protein
MNKKKGQEMELPPTWEEMRSGEVSSPKEGGWSTSELIKSWGKNRQTVLEMLHAQGWVCIGKRREPSITGDIKTVPIYAPPK